MRRVLADTYFFLAVLNTRDMDHERALEYFGAEQIEFVTTAWVNEVARARAENAGRRAYRDR